MWRGLFSLALAASVALAGTASATPTTPAHLDAEGQADYQAYLAAPSNKAFAIAPGGAWGWKAQAPSREQAEAAALTTCQANTRQTCVLFASDNAVVWDAAAWSRLWGPYASAAQARQAGTGRERGQRFADLSFRDAQGRPGSVRGLQGKVVVLHFWGAWCGPCRREMPELQKLHDSLKDHPDLAFVLLQVREPFASSQRWASAQGLHLPLFDSGVRSAADAALPIKGGGSLADRDIATVFPTTYVLDKRGIVVFSHFGPVPDWSQYRELLLDVVKRSGR